MQRQKGKVRNHGGESRGFIGATDARRATVRLDLRAYPNTPPCHVVGYAPAIRILSHQNRAGWFTFPRQIWTLYPPGKHKPRRPFFSLAHLGPRSSAAGPTKEGSVNDPKSRAQAPVRSALNEFPANGMPRPSRKNIQLTKN